MQWVLIMQKFEDGSELLLIHQKVPNLQRFTLTVR